jgi:hypothetical protein
VLDVQDIYRLFEQDERILITDAVLAETIWTLKGKRYGIDKTGIVAVICKREFGKSPF